jgi:hypothetical protein
MSEGPCRSCRRHLSAYLDGELSPRRERTLRLHLEGCEACRAHLEELRLVAFETGRVDPPPPEDLEASILRGLESGGRGQAPASRSPWRSPLLVAASAVILAGVVGLGVIGLRDLPAFSPPTRTSELDRSASARGDSAPSSEPLLAEKDEPAEEERPDAQPEGPSAPAEKLVARKESPEPATAGSAEDRRAREKAPPPPSTPTEGVRTQRAVLEEEGKRGREEDLRVVGDLEAASEPPVAGSRRAAAEQEGRDDAMKKGEVGGAAAAAAEGPREKSVAFGLADEAGAEEATEGGCPGPPVAEPLPGEVLGCLAPAGGRPVRIHLRPADSSDPDAFAASRAELAPTAAPEPWPGPLPVPAAAAERGLELLLDLRLAPDGAVLSVEPLSPAVEGSLAEAVCRSVARWRFRPVEGEAGAAERRARLFLRLEPAGP